MLLFLSVGLSISACLPVCVPLFVYICQSVSQSVCPLSGGRSSVFLSCQSVTVRTKRAGNGEEDAECRSCCVPICDRRGVFRAWLLITCLFVY